jgi:hypothetical protein
VYIGDRVQADGKGPSGRRTVRVWRVFPVGSFPHTADLVAGRRSLRTHRFRPCSRAGGSGDAALGLGILAAVLRRESSRGWLLAAAGADAADLVLTLTDAWSFGRRTRLVTLVGIALNVMVQLYLAFDQENYGSP